MKQSSRPAPGYEGCFIAEINNDRTAADTVPKGKTLEDLSWFHGDLSRNAAEALLLSNGKEGTYLLRTSRKNSGYSVSVRCHDSVKHYVVHHDNIKNIFTFGIATFYSLTEFLEHFESFPVLSSLSGMTVVLRYPYSNDVKEFHDYTGVIRHGEVGKDSAHILPKEEAPDFHVGSKEGYLIKRGAIHKNWKKRWFVVKRNMLNYYNNRQDTKSLKEVDISKAIEVAEDFTFDRKNCFRLVFPTRTFYLLGGSPLGVKDWIDFFQWKIEYFKKKDNRLSES